VIDLSESALKRRPGRGPDSIEHPGVAEVVDAIVRFDRTDAGLDLLKEWGLTYGMLLDLSIAIDRERPTQTADPKPGTATKRAVRLLWMRGFEPRQIAKVLELSQPLVATMCERLEGIEDLRNVVRLHIAGDDAPDIARSVGLDLGTVTATLRRAGFVPRGAGSAPTGAQRTPAGLRPVPTD
jgi:hypothetical protein